jgi:type II secretory pathway component GspD/PulD (secretin)
MVAALSSMGLLLSFGAEPPAPGNDNAPREECVSEVIQIKHERAADIAAILNAFTNRYHVLGTNALASKRGAESAISNARANVNSPFKVVADEKANSLLLYAQKGDLSILKETIAKLDEAREGILIEAVVFEVTLNGTNSDHAGCFNEPILQFPEPTSREPSTNALGILGMKEGNLDEMITRMADHKEVRILQRPRIQTADGIAASLFVGDSRYCASSTDHNETRAVRETDHYSPNELLGVTLEVSPTITPDRKLLMNIAQTIEKYAGTTNVADVGEVPITTRHSLQTEVTVADRQTVIFAGPVEDTQNKPSKGVPLLKNTPLIGGLFRNHPHKVKVETLLALRATILPQQQAKAR